MEMQRRFTWTTFKNIFVFLVLALIVIGFLLLGVLAILGIVFPIIGGIKASNGEVWPYPLSIKFFN